MSASVDPGLAMLRLLGGTARGPKREGTFAVWLTMRVAEDLTLPDRPGERAHRRRVLALEQRLTSLTLPAPLRRGLQATLAQLRNPRPELAAVALSQLVAPVRESLGAEAAEAVRGAAAAAQGRVAGRLRQP
jgi:hypothetical protein